MNPKDEVRLVIASEVDTDNLYRIQCAAFDSEAQMYLMTSHRGPDGYDTLEGIKELMERADLFKIAHNDTIVGGSRSSIQGTVAGWYESSWTHLNKEKALAMRFSFCYWNDIPTLSYGSSTRLHGRRGTMVSMKI